MWWGKRNGRPMAEIERPCRTETLQENTPERSRALQQLRFDRKARRQEKQKVARAAGSPGVRAPNRQPRKETPPRQPRVQKKRLWRDDGFFRSDDWRKLRYRALVKHGARCQCCGADRRSGITIHVDHIISRHKCPELEFELSNLQVLCEACNIGKGWRDETDWRDGSVIWGDKWTESGLLPLAQGCETMRTGRGGVEGHAASNPARASAPQEGN